MLRILVLGLVALAHVEAHADYCEDANLVIDTKLTWNFAEGFQHDIALPTHRGGVLLPGKSVLHLASDGRAALNGIFDFPRGSGQAGYEYNLFRLTIQIGRDEDSDHQIIDQDYTGDCTGPGYSLWPGDWISLKPIKIEPHADGTPRGVEAVHLRFWGK